MKIPFLQICFKDCFSKKLLLIFTTSHTIWKFLAGVCSNNKANFCILIHAGCLYAFNRIDCFSNPFIIIRYHYSSKWMTAGPFAVFLLKHLKGIDSVYILNKKLPFKNRQQTQMLSFLD